MATVFSRPLMIHSPYLFSSFTKHMKKLSSLMMVMMMVMVQQQQQTNVQTSINHQTSEIEIDKTDEGAGSGLSTHSQTQQQQSRRYQLEQRRRGRRHFEVVKVSCKNNLLLILTIENNRAKRADQSELNSRAKVHWQLPPTGRGSSSEMMITSLSVCVMTNKLNNK